MRENAESLLLPPVLRCEDERRRRELEQVLPHLSWIEQELDRYRPQEAQSWWVAEEVER